MRVLPTPLRRLLLPVQVAVVLVVLAAFAAATVVAAAAAPFGRRRRPLRICTFGMAYCSIELVVIARAGLLWLRQPRAGRYHRSAEETWLESNQALLGWALTGILGAARRCFGFVVTIEAEPEPASFDDTDPALVLSRHAGPGDSFALVHLLMTRYGRRVPVVMKEILQLDPVVDLLLNRLGSCFLPAARTDGDDRARCVGRTAASVGPGEALLLFPEGANWTPNRRWRAVSHLRERGERPASRAALLMTHVLPPRLGGVLACLDARPDLQVMTVAHAGLDRITTIRRAWYAIPVDAPMTVRMWPAAPPPRTEQERRAWLRAEWVVVDEWVDRHHAGASSNGTERALPQPP